MFVRMEVREAPYYDIDLLNSQDITASLLNGNFCPSAHPQRGKD